MSKLRLDIKSTSVLGVYGIVNIIFNGTNLAVSKQLSATVESLEYDVDILTSSDNVLKVSLVNDQAHDGNSDGDFDDGEDQTLIAIINAMSYSFDNINYTNLLPQTQVTHTVSSGAAAGQSIVMRPNITAFNTYGLDSELKFNSEGLANTPNLQGYYVKLDGGIYYDANGNVLPN